MSSLIMLILTFIFDLSISGCPPGYQLTDNLCLALKSAPHSDWDHAAELCTRDHTRLARIESKELSNLAKILPRGVQAWIGLRYDKILHKWIWTKDRSSADISQPYLKNLDVNAISEDDCALIKMKKGLITIETDTCADKWINYGLCATEVERCDYSTWKEFSDCQYENGSLCSKRAFYSIDGGKLPKHANSCQIEDINCKVLWKNAYNENITCSIACGENLEPNDTFSLTNDCKTVVRKEYCNCTEAEIALQRHAKQATSIGLYVAIGLLCSILIIIICTTIVVLIRKRLKYHTERIQPPRRPQIPYSLDQELSTVHAVNYRSTVKY